MKNSKLAPIAFLALFALMLLLSGTSNAQTAVVIAEDFASFDVKRTVNTYTHANIYENVDGKTIKFVLNEVDGTSTEYVYRIIKRRKNGRLMHCENLTNGDEVLIEQTNSTMILNFEYNKLKDRYNSAIKFSKVIERNIG